MYTINENETVMRYGELVSKKEVYENYLKNEKMDISKKITSDYIEIGDNTTTYLRHEKIKFVTKKEFLELIKEVKAICKEKNVKLVNINKLTKNIKEHYNIYTKEYNEYSENFKKISELWKNHDMRYGYSDDFYYQDVVQSLSFSLDYAKNKKICTVRSLYDDLLDLNLLVRMDSNPLISKSVNSLDILTK